MMMRWLLALALFAGCDSEDMGSTDAGEDASEPYDSGSRDAAPRRDSGFMETPDAGFSDPANLLEGIEYIGGVRIYIRMRGTLTSTLPPVLFLGTGPSIGHEYLVEPMDFLLPDRLLILFDLRSTGRSGFGTLTATTPMPMTVDTHVEDVENVVAFVENLAAIPKLDIMAHGYGTGVAVHYARKHPDRVSRLVLTAPYPATVLQHALFRAELSARLSTGDREQVLAITREPDCRGNIQQCSIQLWHIEGPHYLCEENRALFDTMTFRYADFRAGFLYIERNLRDTSYDWTNDLTEVTAPTTIVSGPCDPIPAEAALTYASQIAGSQHFIIPDTGHFPMVEDSAAYQTIVKRALRYP